MTPEVESRVIAFVRVVADRCHGCFRRREENCARCDSRTATRLLEDVERDVAIPPKDYSLFARMQLIAEALGRAGKPLLSSEIDVRGLCTKQLKRWTLLRMMRIGVVGRVPAQENGRCAYRYFLKNQKETKQ